MKICHVTNVHPPEDGRIFRRACVSCVLAGYDTYLVEQGETYEKDGVHIIGLGKPEKNDRYYRMTTWARKAYDTALKVDADLYQLHDPELLPYAIKLKRKGKKVVFDSHENYFVMMDSKTYMPFPKLFSKLFKQYAINVFSKIDGITYPCDDEYLREIKMYCSHVCSTANYPWKSELYDKRDESIGKEERTACYVGTLGRDRGTTNIIKACHKAGCKLYLAGKSYSDAYLKELQNMPEYSCVEYLGLIDREEVLNLYQRVQIGLSIDRNVGQNFKARTFATKIFEYMAMGIPFIAQDSPFYLETIQKIKTGICVDPDNYEAISKAITDLLNNDKQRKEMGENGRKASLNYYCWDVEQENLLKMYEKIFSE